MLCVGGGSWREMAMGAPLGCCVGAVAGERAVVAVDVEPEQSAWRHKRWSGSQSWLARTSPTRKLLFVGHPPVEPGETAPIGL